MIVEAESEQHPLVTFIVAVYNLPVAFLKECLDSILAVSLDADEREIIIVDDGSREPVRPELAEYKQFVRFFRQTNQGLSAARNLGIEHAHGRYLQFVDGDDMLIPENYDKILACMRNNLTDIVLFELTDKVEESQAKSLINESAEEIRQWSLAHNLRAAACGYLFKAELLSSGLTFTPGIYHEDEAFTPLLFDSAHTVTDTGIPAYYYRQREGSITNSVKTEHLEKRFADMMSVIIMLREKAEATGSALLTRRYRQLTMDFIYNVMKLIGSPKATEEYIEKLRNKQLFPLYITKAYTHKYWLFAHATRYRSVRKAMSIQLKRK